MTEDGKIDLGNIEEIRRNVAIEIFSEIEPWLKEFRNNCCTSLQFITFLTELKEKYNVCNEIEK